MSDKDSRLKVKRFIVAEIITKLIPERNRSVSVMYISLPAEMIAHHWRQNYYILYPWGRLDYIRNSKTNKSVSVSVIFWKLI